MWSVTEVFEKVHDRPLRVVSIESAELTKVAYNVYLSAKIAFANYIGEIAHKTGADADEVTDSLALATERILSPRYMRAGMGDGGGCHPRDLIALSHLAERADLSFDLAGALMSAREEHSSWLAGLARDWARTVRLPIVVLGRAYKPESNLCLGSPAALLVSQLRTPKATPESWDPHIDTAPAPSHRAVFVVATKHAEFATFDYPPGSVVLDPWGYVEDRPGVTVVRIGRKG
jgi:UDPglucose 6-dehydrogenase